MREVKQISIENGTYYFFNNIINLKNSESNFVKNRQKIVQKHWYLQH